ncbi:flagellin N-terminal helical domain-containing protein [Clostridium sp. HV4-5-A1G]|uniref:flagellin N-terminal helical domain-containing protein n=1 Tax=Clostridium sp. HV4-5-A1G TaxID=2004595 RepID=UPI0012386D86|nr:flagellin [Clostridium sp. HV4-5-A1G]KAA8678174.1 flagellin [Clostridium sp. HV4-5-A1G]
MIINHNLMANNALRNMNINSNNASKAMEKLSSGLRINRAGDDAAGLAISEKMRGQINGLNQASSNSQDAISLIQTAEGALNETHSILQRMRTLAVQSATDTNTDDDRTKIQSEVDQLAEEITRISNTTEFNTQNLLAGGLNDTFQIGANQNQTISLHVNAMDAKSLGVSADLINTSITAAHGVTGISGVTEDLGAGAKVTASDITAATYTAAQGSIKGALADASSAYTGSEDVNYQIRIKTIGTPATGDVTSIEYSKDGGTTWEGASGTGTFNLGDGVKVSIASDSTNAVGQTGTMAVTAEYATLQLANTAGNIGDVVTVHNNQSSVVIGDDETGRTATAAFTFASLTSGDAGIAQNTTASTAAVIDAQGNVTSNAVVQKGINVSTQSAAGRAITTIDNAIKTVSESRAKLGAYQNRLEHTINNLGTSSENLTSAESRIRDVDMASEMSEYSKNNILSQAAQAMLAQANTQPQQVLQLLR